MLGFEQPIPGVFDRVIWNSAPADTICADAVRAITKITGFDVVQDLKEPRLPKDWRCHITLKRPTSEGRRKIGITHVALRTDNALNVEFGSSPST